MKLLGITLRKPNFGEFTAAGVMAAGLWVLALAASRVLEFPVGKADAGALLLVIFWGCVSARVGIRIGMGHRHLVANLLVSALLLGVYQGAQAFAG